MTTVKKKIAKFDNTPFYDERERGGGRGGKGGGRDWTSYKLFQIGLVTYERRR